MFLADEVTIFGELTFLLVVIVPAALRVEVIFVADYLRRTLECRYMGLDIVSERVGIHLIIGVVKYNILIINEFVAFRVKITEFGYQRVVAGVSGAAVKIVGDILIHIVIYVFRHHTHRIGSHHHIVAHTGEASLAVIIQRIAPQMHRVLFHQAVGVDVAKSAESVFGRIVERRIAKHRRAVVIKLHITPQHLDIRAIFLVDLQGVGIDNLYLVNLRIVLRQCRHRSNNGNRQ